MLIGGSIGFLLYLVTKKLIVSPILQSLKDLIYKEDDLLIKCIKEFYNNQVSRIIISGNKAYIKIKKFLK